MWTYRCRNESRPSGASGATGAWPPDARSEAGRLPPDSRCESGRLSDTLDGVALAARRLQLATQVLSRVSVVGHKLFDPLRDSVLGAGDLTGYLVHVRVGGAIPLALTPQACVLVAQVCDRTTHLALDAVASLRLRARHLLAAVAAEDQERTHLSPPSGEVGRSPAGGAGSPEALRSATTALLNSLNRMGAISNTASGRPAAAQTAVYARRSRSMNTGTSVAWPKGGTPPIE